MKTRIIRNAAVTIAWMSFPMPLALIAQTPAVGSQALLQVNESITSVVRSGVVSGPKVRSALTARRNLLKEVLRNAPESARSYALDDSTRSTILAADVSAAVLLEQDETVTGELVSSVADDFQHGTASSRYSLHTFDRDLDLSFAKAMPGIEHLAHQNVTVHGISLDSIMAADSLVKATPAEIEQCASAQSAAASPLASAAGAAPATCSTTGTQRIAVLLVNFPGDTPAFPTGLDQAAYWNKILFGPNPSVNGYWNEVSYGQTSATGDVYGPFALAQAYDCDSTADMQTAAIAAAAASGKVDFTQYNRYVIVFPVTSCWFGGLANIGCQSATSTINHQYSIAWLPISSWYEPDDVNPQEWGAAAHELGHNLGLNHANTLDFGSVALGPLDFVASNPGTVSGSPPASADAYPAASSAPITAVNTEYGDIFSAMGSPWNNAGPYSAEHRANILGWIPKTDEADITTSGAFTLAPAEDSSGLRAIHVLRDPISNSWLWLEFHQPAGFYTPNNIAELTGNTLTNGALIHYEDGYLDSLHTYLLDMKPVASPNSFPDSTLAPGSSWSDPDSLLTLTIGTQTSSSLGITVSYDTPCAVLSLSSSEIPFAGGTANLTITAPSTCSWSVSSNASWISFSGTTSGSGSATIPFAYTSNTAGTQRNSYITAQRQSLPVVQDGPGITIVGVSPNMGSGSAQSFVLDLADAAGESDYSGQGLWFDIGGHLGWIGPCDLWVWLSGSNPISTQIQLQSDASGGGGWITVGSSGSVSNSSCTVYGSGSSAVFNGNQMLLTLNIGFLTAFTGVQQLSAQFNVRDGSQVGPFPLGIFTVNTTPPTATPAISPAGGTLTSTQSVTITDATAGATIYYTTDGSGPTTNSTKYTGPITVSQPETINALAIASNYSQSLVASAVFTIATPVLSPNGGSFTWPQSASVTVTDASPGVTIYYTTDGSSPTSNSTKYTGPFTVSQSGSVQAVALAPGIPPSSVVSAYYSFYSAAPILSPNGGTFTSPQTASVTITDATPGAVIYYTTDNSWPTTSSTQYAGPITVSQSEWIIAIAVAPGLSQGYSEVYYSVYAATPVLSPNGGTFTSVQKVTITDSTPGATIYYTTDNTWPTTSSPQYTGPITVAQSEWIIAIAIAPGLTENSAAEAYYSISLPTGTMVSPSPGSTLTAASTTFAWNAGTGGATGYYLWVGTSPATNNLAQIGLLSGTSTTVTLPTNGATIYVRLWTVKNGTTYLYNDYTYTEFTQSAATMASPSSGSTLSSASTTFTWNAGAGGVTGYYLWVGTSPGTNNLAQIGLLSGTSTTVTLPINGATIYVRLWTVINGTTYLYNDYTYTEFTQSAATMASPSPGSTLTSASTTFTWNAGTGGVTGYYLWVGTAPAADNLAQIGLLSGTSTTVNLPSNGATVYVRLWTVINGTTYLYKDYTYTGFTQSAATMASPSPGSTLTAASTTFTWNAGAGGVTGYYLWVGTSPGTGNLAQVGLLSGASTTVTLPTNGTAVYVRLWTVINGTTYLYNDYTYTELTQTAAMIGPTPGSTLTAASTTFTWNAGAGGVTGYYLWVGTSPGTNNLAQIGLLSGTSTTVTLPVNGATIYVRLWTVINGTTYLYNDYTYTELTQAATMISPSPGSTLTAASTTFTWNAGSGGVTGYYLWVGTSPGTNNLAQIGLLSGTSTTVTLPTNGATIYVRLWTVINGTTYLYNDYTYTDAP